MAHITASSLSLTNALVLMASLMQDESATRPFWTSAQKTTALQDWYVRWYERFSDRLAQYAGAATFGSISSTTRVKRTSDNTIQAWRHAYIETNSTNFAIGTELESNMRPERVRALQLAFPATGTPTCIGFERVAGITKATSGDSVGYWDAYLWPIPNATFYVSAHVRTTPYVPVAGADVFDCGPAQVRIVCALAAIEGASLSGRDSKFIDDRWKMVPDETQAILRAEMQTKVLQTQAAAGAPVT
jgi:hypothetical protein